jgi:hypothetical protein
MRTTLFAAIAALMLGAGLATAEAAPLGNLAGQTAAPGVVAAGGYGYGPRGYWGRPHWGWGYPPRPPVVYVPPRPPVVYVPPRTRVVARPCSTRVIERTPWGSTVTVYRTCGRGW